MHKFSQFPQRFPENNDEQRPEKIQGEIHETLHAKALKLVKSYLHSEAELFEIIRDIFKTRTYQALGYASLHLYCVNALNLSEYQAYAFSTVVRKSESVPELTQAIVRGELNINTARKITSVINPENKEAWIEKAIHLKQKALEIEVAKANPRAAVPDKVKPIADQLHELRCGISEETQEILKRCQDLESQRTQKAALLDDTLRAMGLEYLKKHDPVQKAERFYSRRKLNGPDLGLSINSSQSVCAGASKPGAESESKSETEKGFQAWRVANQNKSQSRVARAQARHEVSLRDAGQCVFVHPDGTRCPQKRWVERHHRIFYSKGGLSVPPNLVTLCHFHHRSLH